MEAQSQHGALTREAEWKRLKRMPSCESVQWEVCGGEKVEVTWML